MKLIDKALLLALEAMLDTNSSLKERNEMREKALLAIRDALEKGGARWPTSTNSW